MKFERLTNEFYGARKAGYVIDTDAPRVTDADLCARLEKERGSRFVEGKLDALYDFDGDLYKAENGDLYAVEYVFTDDGYEPLCWQRVKKEIHHKPTLKSINENLPRLDVLRRNYMVHGTTGYTYGRQFIKAAFANLDESGNVDDIRIYAEGDAMERRHYYSEKGTVDITGVIEEAVLCEDKLFSIHYNCRDYRAYIVRRIQEIIEEN